MVLLSRFVNTAISTHTLTLSVTSTFHTLPFFENYFNSHAHVERDTENLENVVDMGISTHTLTWSVTL